MSAASDLQHIDAKLDGIGHLLRDFNLSVPAYQRPYAWGAEQVEAFWLDLRAAVHSPDHSYFLGTVVLAGAKTSRIRTVIDGQQRLATTALLFAAIRDAFSEFGDESRAEVVQNEYLTQRSLKLSIREARLKLNTQDALFFESALLKVNSDLIPQKFASNKNLADAHNYLKARLAADIDQTRSGWQDQLLHWVEFLESGARVIVVEVLSDADAFMVFETLNDRGLPLSVADLLKNHILSLVTGAERPQAEEQWLRSISILDEPEGAQHFLNFLRQYWSSIHGITRERDLYKSLRRHIRSGSEAINFSTRLSTGAAHYLTLVSGEALFWPNAHLTEGALVSLWKLRLSQHLPMLLAAMDNFNEGELDNLVKHTLSWSIRGLIVGGLGGGLTETKYAEAAVEIRKGKLTTASAVLAAIRQIVPTDEVFSAAVADASLSRQFVVRYLLLAMERHLAGLSDAAFVPRDGDADVSAFRLTRDGSVFISPEFKTAEGAALDYRLGSYVLIEKILGRKLQTATTWIEAAGILSQSRFSLTRKLSTLQEFNPSAMKSRQQLMASLAIQIWPDQIV